MIWLDVTMPSSVLRRVDAGDAERREVEVLGRAATLARLGEAAPGLVGLLRDDAFDVDRVQRQRAGCRGDAVDLLDRGHLGGREAELRGRDEVVAGERLARLAEVAEAEAGAAVLLLQLLALLVGETAKAPFCAFSSNTIGRVTDMSVPTPVSGSSTSA